MKMEIGLRLTELTGVSLVSPSKKEDYISQNEVW